MAERTPFVMTTPSREHRYFKAMFWGSFGSGKTYLAASAQDCPAMQDVLFIDAEAGDLTLRDRWPEMTVISISAYAQLARVYEFLRYHCQLREAGDEAGLLDLENKVHPEDEQVSEPHHFYTVVIDSLSEVQSFLHYQLLGIRLGRQALDDELAKAGWDEFDKSINMMRLLVRSFRDLPMNVILVAGEQTKTDNTRIVRSTNFQGKLTSELPGFMDLVGYLEASQPDKHGVVHRRLHLQSSKTFGAKSRISAIKTPWLDDPTMTTIASAAGLRKPVVRKETTTPAATR